MISRATDEKVKKKKKIGISIWLESLVLERAETSALSQQFQAEQDQLCLESMTESLQEPHVKPQGKAHTALHITDYFIAQRQNYLKVRGEVFYYFY